MVARDFGGWLLSRLIGGAVIASAAFPVCKVVTLCAGSAFVAPQLVAGDKKRVGAIAPLPGKEVLCGALEVVFSSFSGLAFQDVLFDPEWEALGKGVDRCKNRGLDCGDVDSNL